MLKLSHSSPRFLIRLVRACKRRRLYPRARARASAALKILMKSISGFCNSKLFFRRWLACGGLLPRENS